MASRSLEPTQSPERRCAMRRALLYLISALALALPLSLGTSGASAAVGQQLLLNPGAETGTGTTPANWTFSSWSTDRKLLASTSWSTDAHTGARSLRVDITARPTDGDAKWAPDPVAVSGGAYYTLSDWYKSNANSAYAVEYWTASQPVTGDGTFVNLFSGIAPAPTWTQYQSGFTMPSDAAYAILVHYLPRVGWLETDDYAMTEQAAPPGYRNPMISLTFDDGSQNDYNNALPLLNQHGFKSTQYIPTGDLMNKDYSFMLTPAELQTELQQGHEIGGHTMTHADLTTCTPTCDASTGVTVVNGYRTTTLTQELANSKTFLESTANGGVGLGAGTVTGLAYPYGSYDANVIAAAKAAGYVTGRSTEAGYNNPGSFEPYDIQVQNMTPSTTIQQFDGWVDYAVAHQYWLVIVYHEVWPDATKKCAQPDGDNCIDAYDTTVSQFTQQLNYIGSQVTSKGLQVLTVRDAFKSFAGQVPPTAGSVAITPGQPSTNALLTAMPTGFSAVDGGTLTYHYQWYVGSTAVAGATSQAFDLSVAGHGDHGDGASVQVYATDSRGLNSSTTTSPAVTIVNSPPTTGSVTITPAAPTSGTALTATSSGFADIDNDALSQHYQWSINGTQVAGATAATFTPTSAGHGDTIAVTTWATDPSGASSPNATASVSIANRAPTKGTVTITPAAPTSGTALTATPSGFTDPDGDTLTYHYAWYHDEQPITGATAATLPAATVVRGQIRVDVTADDSHSGTIDVASATVAISALPIIPVADTTPPAIAIDSPRAKAYQLDKKVPIAFSCTDMGGSGMASCTATLSRFSANAKSVASGEKVALSQTGRYVLRITAKDQSGNVASTAVTFTVIDKAAPRISVTSRLHKTYKLDDRVVVRFSIKDASGIAKSTATFGPVGGRRRAVRSGQTMRLSRPGRYVLRIAATDRHGNSAVTTVALVVKH
jgi:peptidoglycan/xylan/chitin deacetylase (PgdA/CDA1 family)/antitoxin (DNA-binding transcriptional repressor) of toxin-antitoxin stability system